MIEPAGRLHHNPDNLRVNSDAVCVALASFAHTASVMNLKNHFRPPIQPRHSIETFHSRWASAIMDRLNELLPPRYLVECHVRVCPRVAADVGKPSKCEVHVYDLHRDRRLVGVVEIVSPDNKAGPAERSAFTSKCQTYLHRGLGLVVVDIVLNRAANLHDELMARLGHAEPSPFAGETTAYATAYRCWRSGERGRVEMWLHALPVGEPLPTVPLALRGGPVVPCELGSTYAQTCQVCRIE